MHVAAQTEHADIKKHTSSASWTEELRALL